MKKFNLQSLIFTAALLTFCFSNVGAQEESASSETPKQNLKQTRRPNLLAELDLSPDQIRQIRRINREKQLLIRQAKQRVAEADRNLDQAIYSDVADENQIKIRLKEEQAARAELSKLKALTEYEVRKTLNLDQLAKFREVRERFRDRMENTPKQRGSRPLAAPGHRLVNRQRKSRQSN